MTLRLPRTSLALEEIDNDKLEVKTAWAGLHPEGAKYTAQFLLWLVVCWAARRDGRMSRASFSHCGRSENPSLMGSNAG